MVRLKNAFFNFNDGLKVAEGNGIYAMQISPNETD